MRAHRDFVVHLYAIGLGDDYTAEGQLEEVCQEIGTMVNEEGSRPVLTLLLTGVTVPTEEEWHAVSSAPSSSGVRGTMEMQQGTGVGPTGNWPAGRDSSLRPLCSPGFY